MILRNCVLIALLAITSSCRDGLTEHRHAIQSGMAVLPWPKQIEGLFGEADHFITHYNLDRGPKAWNTAVGLFGRYRLTLQVEVNIDYQKSIVLGNATNPIFYLFEIESIKKENGRIVGANFSNQWTFDAVSWKKLYESNGDWSTIGIPLKQNDPIPGFDEYDRSWREPRIRLK